jgi:anthranilate synthase/aminodeoxychorismate synthase-like glutamine amidotransferase
MILVVDNYDSFTWNLVQYIEELGREVAVRRSDELTVADVDRLAPEAVVVSPGPGTPGDAGVSVPLIRHAAGRLPILGVCLGHQAIAEAFGGRIVRARDPMHGKTSRVDHSGRGIFAGLPNPLVVMRYHSLTVDPTSLPAELLVEAVDSGGAGEIHALRHRDHPIFGVQFHPESILSESGRELLSNFLAEAA